jgi:hypothetical protein
MLWETKIRFDKGDAYDKMQRMKPRISVKPGKNGKQKPFKAASGEASRGSFRG